jgi:nicotinamidase-related amidase
MGKEISRDVVELLSPNQTGILVVDLQNDFVSSGGFFDKAGADLAMVQESAHRTASVVDAARRAGALPVFVYYTQLSAGRSDSLAYARRRYTPGGLSTYCVEGTWGHAYPEFLTPAPGDLEVIKYRGSSFHGTPLNLLLRAREIRTLVITGAVTEGCVAAAAYDAGANDYDVVVASDCIGSYDAEMHRAAAWLLGRREMTVTSEDLIRLWGGQS